MSIDRFKFEVSQLLAQCHTISDIKIWWCHVHYKMDHLIAAANPNEKVVLAETDATAHAQISRKEYLSSNFDTKRVNSLNGHFAPQSLTLFE
jgi:hypothetical protein